MTEVGVIHGRFQVLHHDHMAYLMAGRARCRHLVVGITNPDPLLTREDDADPHRGAPRANPLTYYERCVMIRAAMVEAGVHPMDFTIVPFPINLPELYSHYLPMDAVFYLTIYDDWGRRKLELFQSLGLRTEVLWDRGPESKGLSATDIRRRMASGEPWESMVPASVAVLLNAWRIPDRLRRAAFRDPC
ncbi:MAG: nicotinate-nucleotide adenylyltransferase [Syntrophobacteraceae bacterium]|nr:nicotinate-nucleotide adenylyltransferase [Syntrophobacteraceae bacterium]